MPPITLWDLDDDPDGNVQHIAEHGLTKEDVDSVVAAADRFDFSRSSGQPILFGFAPDGRYIAVVYAEVDEDTISPVTAYKV
jgi:uncharacterized DUF497 family protein